MGQRSPHRGQTQLEMLFLFQRKSINISCDHEKLDDIAKIMCTSIKMGSNFSTMQNTVNVHLKTTCYTAKSPLLLCSSPLPV